MQNTIQLILRKYVIISIKNSEIYKITSCMRKSNGFYKEILKLLIRTKILNSTYPNQN
jgi:hypothetical protein